MVSGETIDSHRLNPCLGDVTGENKENLGKEKRSNCQKPMRQLMYVLGHASARVAATVEPGC